MTKEIESILIRPVPCNSDGIYDYTIKSATQQYFTSFASGTTSEVRQTEGYKEMTEKTAEARSTRIMNEIVSMLKSKLDPEAIVIEIGGGSSGQTRSGKGYLAFKNYYPLDISYAHINAYTERYNRKGFTCNAETLPFKDCSVDCIYTNAFLEHPISPDKVVAEIARVIKPGGIVLHNDAWFCRWWQTYGVHRVKKWSEMNFKEKVIDIAANITEAPVIRIPPIIIRRLFKKFINKKEKVLTYKKLKPNYDLYLGCDEDAAASIDPVDVISFYEEKGFKLMKELSFKERLLYPNKFIALVKR